MKILNLLILLSPLLISTQSIACTTIRLDLDPQVLGKVPAQSQGRTMGCYAFAAAQLIDAARISAGESAEFLTSPIPLAITSGDLIGGSGGTVFDSIESARKRGICSQKAVSEFIGSVKAEEFIEQMNSIYNESIGSTAKQKLFFESNNKSKMKFKGAIVNDEFAEAWSRPVSNIMKQEIKLEEKYTELQKKASEKYCQYTRGVGVTALPVAEVLQSLRWGRTNFVKDTVESVCGPLLKPKIPESTLHHFWNEKNDTPPDDVYRAQSTKKVISKALQSKKPIAVQFCQEVVTDPMHIGRYTGESPPLFTCEKKGNHAAVVVGRQFNKKNKRCELLVRDSYCENYKRPPHMTEDFCKNGQYWISENDLAYNTQLSIEL